MIIYYYIFYSYIYIAQTRVKRKKLDFLFSWESLRD